MLVTDDEIVAASAQLDRRWQGLLPSIDQTVDGSLAAAAARGLRSLRIRSLFDADGMLGDSATDLSDAAGGTLRVIVYPAGTDRPLAPIGASVSVIEASERWLLDVTTPDGTHEIGPVEGRDAAWRAVESLLATAPALPKDRVLTAVAVLRNSDEGVFISINGSDAITGAVGSVEAPVQSTVGSATGAVDLLREVFAR